MEIEIFRAIFDVLEKMRTVTSDLSILAIPLGLLLLFVGWKFYSAFIALPGLIIGGAIGNVVAQGEESTVLIVATIASALGGWAFFAFLHGVTIWSVGAIFGYVLINGIWQDVFSQPAPYPFVFFGAVAVGVLVAVIYGRLIGVIAAVLGSFILGDHLGFGGIYVVIVAAVGFWVQYNLARAWGDDVFRRQTVREKRRAQRKTHQEKRKTQKYQEVYDNYAGDSFDPNAEIQVVED